VEEEEQQREQGTQPHRELSRAGRRCRTREQQHGGGGGEEHRRHRLRDRRGGLPGVVARQAPALHRPLRRPRHRAGSRYVSRTSPAAKQAPFCSKSTESFSITSVTAITINFAL